MLRCYKIANEILLTFKCGSNILAKIFCLFLKVLRSQWTGVNGLVSI